MQSKTESVIDKLKQRRLKGKDFLYGILVALSSSIIIEGLFEFIKTNAVLYLFIIILGIVLTLLFFYKYKKAQSIPDLIEYRVSIVKRKRLKWSHFYNLFEDSLKDSLKKNEVERFKITRVSKSIKKHIKVDERIGIWRSNYMIYRTSRIYFYNKEPSKIIFLIDFSTPFGEKLNDSIKDTLKYLKGCGIITNKSKLKFSGYFYFHFLAPLITKGKSKNIIVRIVKNYYL